MKNKLCVDFVASARFGDSSIKSEEDPTPASGRGNRDPSTPRIIICPPMEETSETAPVRGGRLLRALGRTFSRRSNDGDSLDSSSSDSSEQGRGDDHSSCSASESSSDGSERPRRHRSTVSLRRVFQSLNLTSRSHSCSPTEQARQPKKQQQPKRILRPPITYTYVRGLSGLPTQRVPRHMVYCASSGLNR